MTRYAVYYTTGEYDTHSEHFFFIEAKSEEALREELAEAYLAHIEKEKRYAQLNKEMWAEMRANPKKYKTVSETPQWGAWEEFVKDYSYRMKIRGTEWQPFEDVDDYEIHLFDNWIQEFTIQ